MIQEMTHFDEEGNARMVDVSDKDVTKRTAVAEGSIRMSEEAFRAVMEHRIAKGDVLTVAQVAGIAGTKKTSELIPMCHLLALTGAGITFETDPDDYEFDTNEVEIDFTRKAAKVLLEKKNDFDAFVDNAGFTVYEWNNDTNRYMSFANMEYDSTLKKYVLPENVYLYADEKNENKFMIVETSVPYGYSETKAFKTTFTIPDDANKAVQNISIEGENEVASTIVNVLKYEEQTEDQILAEEPKVPLDGAVFEFFAAEDIYTPEGSEKGILIYHKDEKIGEAVSDENGLATSNEKYYPGEYYFKEKTAPTGYELNDSEHHFTVDYTPTTCVVSYDDSDDAGEDASKKYIIKAREVSASKTLLLDLNETEQVSYNFEVANNDGSNTTKNGMAYTIRVVYNDDAGSDDNGEGVGNHTIYEEESDMMHAAQICSALNVQIDGADGLEDPTGYGWTFRNSEWNFVRGGEEQSRAHTLTFTGDPKVIDVDFIREHISIYVSATIISDPAEVYDPPIETYEVPSVQKYVHDGRRSQAASYQDQRHHEWPLPADVRPAQPALRREIQRAAASEVHAAALRGDGREVQGR